MEKRENPPIDERVKSKIVPVVLLGVAIAFTWAGCQATRAGYESAPYGVIRKEGKFEVRDYPALTVVETSMAREGDGSDGSFRRLFRFITGRNGDGRKIAMTTPVFMSGSDTDRTMAFVLPAKLKAGEVPKPEENSLAVREVEAGRFAVLRFRGGRSAENEARALARLQSWLAGQGLKADPSPVYGYFDPPWTPAFLRRNEVMLRTQPAP